MADDGYYTAENHGAFETYALGRFEFEEGGSVDDLVLAYATYGELAPGRDNAILVPTWYSGTHGIMSQVYIGPDHALDPTRYFIIVVDQIGSGLSTSPHHGLGDKFPRVRIADDVRAQHQLVVDHLCLDSLALVFGGSMGGQQVYEWAVRYPDMVRRAAPLAATARVPDLNAIFVDAICEAITCDRAFGRGPADAGLRRHARLMAIEGFSTEWWAQRSWSELGFDSADAFLQGFMFPYFAPMDPDNLLCQAWKWQHADVGRHANGDLAAALGRVTAKTFVMPIDEDLFFPEADCRRECELIEGGQLRVVHSLAGHLGLFGLEPSFMEQVDHHLRELLATPA